MALRSRAPSQGHHRRGGAGEQSGAGQVAARTTSITIAEVLYGVARLPGGRRKTLRKDTALGVFSAFADHVLPFDAEAAEEYAHVVTARDRRGTPIDGFDTQIAAICRLHGATLATRSVSDFEGAGLVIIDPWRSGD